MVKRGGAVQCLKAVGWSTLSILVLEAILPKQAAAYVDPGMSGLLSQILYVLFYGALAFFIYFLSSIKQSIANVARVVRKWFRAPK